MLQLQLLGLTRTEEETVEVTGQAELVDLMARILVTVFSNGNKEDR